MIRRFARSFMAIPAALLLVSPAPAAPLPQTLEAFPLSSVRLLPGPFHDALTRDGQYLLSLEPDRLLSGFRSDAGLQPKAPKYGGWESMGVAGHCLGHYLSACAMMYASTGDARFRDRVSYIVGELAACQDANGNGYVSAIPDGKRIFAEVARGEIRSKGFDLNGGWVPWYTQHKVMAGLRDAHVLCGNAKALDVLKKLGDWALATTDKLDAAQLNKMLRCEQGGMNEVAADLYALTNDAKYLALAERFNDHQVLDPLADGQEKLAGLHANTNIPKVIGAARQYELTGDERFKRAAEFFWTAVTTNHTYVMGGNSEGEHFGQPKQLSARLGDKTAETCNTYNMLKLTTHLMSWHPRASLADYYERALYNHILASQDPASGMVCYFVPLKPGAKRTYSTPFESFWCCTGTGMENHAKYGEAIYQHDADSLYVHLFIPSEVEWTQKKLKLKQETTYPAAGSTRLTISCESPTDATLRIRYPGWSQPGATLSVNGKPRDLAGAQPGSYLALKRPWNNGDVVEWTFPIPLRTEPTPDNPDKVALVYGPAVLAADLGEKSPELIPAFVSSDRELLQSVKPVVGEPVTFRTERLARPSDVKLIPFYAAHNTHYVTYFDRFTPDQWAKHEADYRAELERRRELEARTIDSFQPGEMQPERDHDVRSEKSATGEHLGRKWRDASPGGWFSFTMKVDPATPQDLVCTYWGSDAGNRTFDLTVDGQPLATQRLNNDRPGQFFDVTYPLPESMTKDKSTVTVKLQGQPNNTAGGLFGARVVKRK